VTTSVLRKRSFGSNEVCRAKQQVVIGLFITSLPSCAATWAKRISDPANLLLPVHNSAAVEGIASVNDA
jgi:hypothetical protein